jgi:hypothetical protein
MYRYIRRSTGCGDTYTSATPRRSRPRRSYRTVVYWTTPRRHPTATGIISVPASQGGWPSRVRPSADILTIHERRLTTRDSTRPQNSLSLAPLNAYTALGCWSFPGGRGPDIGRDTVKLDFIEHQDALGAVSTAIGVVECPDGPSIISCDGIVPGRLPIARAPVCREHEVALARGARQVRESYPASTLALPNGGGDGVVCMRTTALVA